MSHFRRLKWDVNFKLICVLFSNGTTHPAKIISTISAKCALSNSPQGFCWWGICTEKFNAQSKAVPRTHLLSQAHIFYFNLTLGQGRLQYYDFNRLLEDQYNYHEDKDGYQQYSPIANGYVNPQIALWKIYTCCHGNTEHVLSKLHHSWGFINTYLHSNF